MRKLAFAMVEMLVSKVWLSCIRVHHRATVLKGEQCITAGGRDGGNHTYGQCRVKLSRSKVDRRE